MKFVYEPLPPDAIRILELEPASSPLAPVSCKVEIASLSENPAYEALSYVWGPQNLLYSISCNGSDLQVGQNLYDALRRLRLTDQSRKIWIDAICINQEDPIEKAQQIALMQHIYMGSERTVIWLGPEIDDSDLAFQLLSDLLVSYSRMAERGDNRTFLQMMPSDIRLYQIPGMDGNRRVFQALKVLLERPWFQRAWIIQEACLPPQLRLYCGSYEIEWDSFVIALAFIPKVGLEFIFTNMGGTLSAATMIARLRMETQNGRRSSLLHLLCRSSQCLLTDPRDRIFSLCGLANDADESGLDVKISYVKSYTPRDVFVDFAVSVLKKTRCLDILSVPRRLDGANPLGLSSWAPDSTVTHDVHPLRVQFNDAVINSFCASKSTRINSRDSFLEGDILTVKGLLVDTLDKVGVMARIWQVNEASERWRIDTEKMMNWMDITQADSSTPYKNGEARIDAFWQTLFGGHYATSYEEARQMFYKMYGRIQRSRVYVDWGLPRFPNVMSVVNNVDNTYRWLTGGLVNSSRMNQLTAVQAYRRMAISNSDYFCLVPSIAKPGDSVVVLEGGDVPFILRKRNDVNRWELIGESYVHGIMRGEIWDESKCQDFELS